MVNKNIAKMAKTFQEHAIVQQLHLSETVVTDVRYREVYFFIRTNITSYILYLFNIYH